MKYLIGFLILCSVCSCSLKEAIDNDFKMESEITPMAPAKTLAERFGNGEELVFTLKIPLTEDSVGYYEVADVLGDSQLDSRQKSFFDKTFDSLKLSMFNLFVKLGYSNKMKFSTTFNFPHVDSQYVKSAVVKKVFFTTEDCRKEEQNCNDHESISSNFNLVDKFFLNVSSAHIDSDEEVNIYQVNDEEFDQKFSMAKSQEHKVAFDLNNQDKEINLVSFSNDVPYLNLNIDNVPENTDYLNFNIKKNKRFVGKYLKSNRFKDLIRKVEWGSAKRSSGSLFNHKIKGIDVYLKKGIKPSQLFERISHEQSPMIKRMFIFRLNNNFLEAKKFFSSKELSHLVKDTTMIGKSLFVELHNDMAIKSFEQYLIQSENRINNNFDIYNIERCVKSNCLDLEVKNVNLVPLIERSPTINIDTYLGVRNLGLQDFKYNGFIEVEFVLDVPI